MASCTSATLVKYLVLVTVFLSGVLPSSFGIGIPVGIAENPTIRVTVIVLGISLSIAAGSYIAVTGGAQCDPHADITLHHPMQPERNVPDTWASTVQKVTAVRSRSGSTIHSFDEAILPPTDVPRCNAIPIPRTPTYLESVLIVPALPDFDTSSDSAVCESVRSFNYDQQYSWSEVRRTYRVYDLNLKEKTYSTSKGFVAKALDTVRNSPKPEEVPNRLFKTKSVSIDMNAVERECPAGAVCNAYNDARSLTSSIPDSNIVKPHVRHQVGPVIAINVGARGKVDICNEENSDVKEETRNQSFSEDTVDLQAQGTGVPTKVSLNPLGSSSSDRSYERKVYKTDIRLQQGSITDPNDNQESVKPESEIALVSLSSPTRRFFKTSEQEANNSVCL